MYYDISLVTGLQCHALQNTQANVCNSTRFYGLATRFGTWTSVTFSAVLVGPHGFPHPKPGQRITLRNQLSQNTIDRDVGVVCVCVCVEEAVGCVKIIEQPMTKGSPRGVFVDRCVRKSARGDRNSKLLLQWIDKHGNDNHWLLLASPISNLAQIRGQYGQLWEAFS